METKSVIGEKETVNHNRRKHPFFRRSDSFLCFGCPQPNSIAVYMMENVSLISSGIVSPHRGTSSAAVHSVIVRTGNVVADTVVQRSSSSTTNPSLNSKKTDADAQPSASCSWIGKSAPLPTVGQLISSDLLLGRWRLTLYLFGRVFIDDFDPESGSIIALLRGFHIKEDRFHREKERIRNMQQRDSTFKVDRERGQLIIKTFKKLNAQYINHGRRATAGQPALAVSRVEVTFMDEPGEGSVVARSFYTAIAEAFFTREMPNLDVAQLGVGSKTSQSSMVCIRQLLIYFIFNLLKCFLCFPLRIVIFVQLLVISSVVMGNHVWYP